MDEIIKKAIEDAIVLMGRKAVEEHFNCLDKTINDSIKAGATLEEVQKEIWVNGYAHGAIDALGE